MENGVVKQQRDIAVVTTEIKDICAQAQRMMLIYAVEIGRRLVEAKEILPHGEWGEWLKNEVQFSQSTANKHMQIFKKFGSTQVSLFGAELNSETFTNLSYSQALKLLAVPDEEVEEFVKENNVSELSTRELDKLIKERDAAVAAAEQAADMEERMNAALARAEESDKEREKAELSVKGLETSISELNTKLDKAKADVKKYKDLAKNPEIPKDKLEELKKEAETAAAESKAKEIEEAIKKTKDKLLKAEEARRNAETEADKAKLEIENLKKQVLMADPAVTEFKAQFNTAQDTMNKMITAFKGINDAAMQGRFKQAVSAMFDKYRGEFGLV